MVSFGITLGHRVDSYAEITGLKTLSLICGLVSGLLAVECWQYGFIGWGWFNAVICLYNYWIWSNR